jgi:hypothetical protein
MKWKLIEAAFNDGLAKRDEWDPIELLEEVGPRAAESEEDAVILENGMQGLAEADGVQDEELVSFWWDGGGAPISSYLSVHALRIGSTWFIYFNSDDFPSRVVDRLDTLNRETATEAVGRMCGAEQYINIYYRPSISAGELVDEGRVAAMFSDEHE